MPTLTSCPLKSHLALRAQAPPEFASRLWREDIYELSPSRTDSLASAAQALAEAGDGLIQIAMAPDTGWEKRATRRLGQLSGFDAHESLVSRLIRLPMDLFYDFWFSYPQVDHAHPAGSAPRSARPDWKQDRPGLLAGLRFVFAVGHPRPRLPSPG